MLNSNIGRRDQKPEKPTSDFPLFPHANGRWAKKVRGKTRYFGPWDDPDGALQEWLQQKDDLLAGKNPAKSGKVGRPVKRKKPSPDFPLFPHANGYWAKKIKGRLVYFGKISKDPKGKAALSQWKSEEVAWEEGRNPREEKQEKADSITVTDVCDKFLIWKQDLIDSEELTKRTFDGYKQITDILVATFGEKPAEDLKPDDFQALRAKMAKNWGPVRLGNSIQIVRSVFKFAFENDIIKSSIRFGTFKKPAPKVMLKHKTSKGKQMFSPEQFQAALAKATPNMRAMMLLGLNGGLGNTDVSELKPDAFDLVGGWLDYPRAKTGRPRRIPLWPETIKAVQAVLKSQPEKADLLFVGKRGKTYADGKHGYRVHQEFKRVLDASGVKGRTFYDLRRTFQTIGEGARDLPAVQAIMGHSPSSDDMSSVYRQTVDDERLKAITDHVHAWAFPPKKKATKGKAVKHG